MLEVDIVFEANSFHLLVKMFISTRNFRVIDRRYWVPKNLWHYDTNPRVVSMRSCAMHTSSDPATTRSTFVTVVSLNLGSTILPMFNDRRRRVS